MVDKAELFRIADEILAEGRVPSQRRIRDRLSRGGSFSDVGPAFVEWSVLRNFRPRPTKDALPARLRDRLATVAAEIWRDGLREGAAAGRDERDLLLAERDALRLALAEAAARADALEERGRPEGDGRAGRPSRTHGEVVAFWNRVMLEVEALLEGRQLDAKAIIALMDQGTRREAAAHDEDWGPVLLAKKMRQRIGESKFFEEPARGVFRRRTTAAPAGHGRPSLRPPGRPSAKRRRRRLVAP